MTTLTPDSRSIASAANRERLPWRRALVYGLGASGQAAVALLRVQGVEVVGVDRRTAETLRAVASPAFTAILDAPNAGDGLQLELGAEPAVLPSGLAWSELDAVVVSPGVPADRPLLVAARAAGVPVLAEVELAYRLLDAPVVAITGSNGKSTVTAMTGAIFDAAGWQARVCGNFGEPLSAVVLADLLRGASDKVVYVAELSSFQLETIDRFRPRAAVLLNLAADHLDRHGSLEAYLAAKARIFVNQQPGDVAVLPASDPMLATLDGPAFGRGARRRLVALDATGLQVDDGCVVDRQADPERVVEIAPGKPTQTLFAVDDLRVPGPHNLENAMAAALLARALGVEAEAVRRGLRAFRGLPHRVEAVATIAGVTWYDDSKGTNPAATERALEGFAPGDVRVILGGRFKGGDLGSLARTVAARAAGAYLIGEAADELAAALARAGAPASTVGDLETAVARCAADAPAGSAVLLSPACASFDQFRSFVHRGEEFQRLVRALGQPAQEVGHGA
ncbi:MAG: UDP-N-acetylmuramoyl-L-alanine--D-glutamate ligase [Acidobacteriota bacterium]